MLTVDRKMLKGESTTKTVTYQKTSRRGTLRTKKYLAEQVKKTKLFPRLRNREKDEQTPEPETS